MHVEEMIEECFWDDIGFDIVVNVEYEILRGDVAIVRYDVVRTIAYDNMGEVIGLEIPQSVVTKHINKWDKKNEDRILEVCRDDYKQHIQWEKDEDAIA